MKSGNCNIFCKICTQTKLKEVLYRFSLYFPNFQEDILKNQKARCAALNKLKKGEIG